jgi:hypothetical protein
MVGKLTNDEQSRQRESAFVKLWNSVPEGREDNAEQPWNMFDASVIE